jgi:hypothetical protein
LNQELIHPIDSASDAIFASKTVFPLPRGPVKSVTLFGSPGALRNPSNTSSIILSRPAKIGGSFPNTGVKGFLYIVIFVPSVKALSYASLNSPVYFCIDLSSFAEF